MPFRYHSPSAFLPKAGSSPQKVILHFNKCSQNILDLEQVRTSDHFEDVNADHTIILHSKAPLIIVLSYTEEHTEYFKQPVTIQYIQHHST